MRSHPQSPVRKNDSPSRSSLSTEIGQFLQLWPLIEQALTEFDNDLLYQSWSRNKELGGNLKERIDELLERYQESKSPQREDEARKELECLQNLRQISKYLFGFMKETREKIDRDIIFSPRAYGQLIGLWQATYETLQQIYDLPEKGSTKNGEALTHRSAELTNLIIEYDLEHEDRLLRGICSRNSSSIFLNMLDTLRGIIRCLGTIAALY